MPRIIIVPTRDELLSSGVKDLRLIQYLEDIDGFNVDTVDESNSTFDLLANLSASVVQLMAEIYELKKQVNDLDNRDL